MELITMKARITLAASALALLSLTGCASQAQLDEQNKKLDVINSQLMQITQNQQVQIMGQAETNRWLKRISEQGR